MRKLISTLLVILLLTSLLFTNHVFANSGGGDIKSIKDAMTDIGKVDDNLTGSNTAKLINIVIGILQVAGTGISLIVISILGIKYLLASPSEKADVKKNIWPILIGCILLFAAVNIVGVVENFTNETLPAGNAGGNSAT